jgi:hypothetical protein
LADREAWLAVGLCVGVAVGVFLGWLLARYLLGSKSAVAYKPATYSNVERWTIVKDERGRVKEVVVHREATEK